MSHGVQIATAVEEYDTPDTRRQVINIHARINAAIEAGDADLAERSMRQHLTATHARALTLASSEIPLTEERATPQTVRAGRRAKT